jgi:hypothetical protein
MNWPDAAAGRETGFANRIPAANQIQRIFPQAGFRRGPVRIDLPSLAAAKYR